jgi:SAM-dependent methyltransferase
VVETLSLSPAAQAFDAVAERFDERFGAWLSVAAQRRAVRAALVRAFPPGARVLDVGGGTGEDAVWLTRQGREVLLTDASPTMVQVAAAKLRPHGAPTPLVVSAERLFALAEERDAAGEPRMDGAFSNFAALNCVKAADLAWAARGLARLIRPGGQFLVIVFGVCAPGEWCSFRAGTLAPHSAGSLAATSRRNLADANSTCITTARTTSRARSRRGSASSAGAE